MAWDQPGERLATAWYDERSQNKTTVRIWDVAKNQELAEAISPSPKKGSYGSTVFLLAFSPDGTWLATADVGRVQVWDLASGRELILVPLVFDQNSLDGKRMFRFPDIPDSIAFSPDGRSLATRSRSSKAAAIWEAATGKLVARLPHPGGSLDLVFSPDSRRLATVAGGRWYSEQDKDRPEVQTGQRTVKVWDAATGAEVYHLNHGDVVGSAAFSARTAGGWSLLAGMARPGCGRATPAGKRPAWRN